MIRLLHGYIQLHQYLHSTKSMRWMMHEQVQTLDGKTVWRRRHYRVRRAKQPGTFFFSVLDNGVISKEYWRIVHAAEDLSWALFYYAGAASVVGQAYRGVLCVCVCVHACACMRASVRACVSVAVAVCAVLPSTGVSQNLSWHCRFATSRSFGVSRQCQCVPSAFCSSCRTDYEGKSMCAIHSHLLQSAVAQVSPG